jgi:hypothetical protein
MPISLVRSIHSEFPISTGNSLLKQEGRGNIVRPYFRFSHVGVSRTNVDVRGKTAGNLMFLSAAARYSTAAIVPEYE